MTPDLSHYWTPTGCGGSSLGSSGTTQGTCQRFKIEDVNGGNLMSGDVVHLKFANTWYVSAENEGGGDVSVRYTSAITWEKFIIQKGGGGRIINGDRVSFRTYDGTHFLTAVSYGGSSINATATAVGASEKFVYETDMHGQ
jgi:hypothetical protein